MATNINNVLLPMALPTQKSLRAAIASIIRDIQRDYEEGDQDTADQLGVSAGTVANARNSKADLNAVTIARIGARYGAHHLNPYHALYGSRSTPLETISEDPLSPLSQAVATICKMRCAQSEGGRHETLHEQLNALPDMREAHRSLGAYIAHIEKARHEVSA